jgi:glycosyltransferase involved in cell wall biosynthesis
MAAAFERAYPGTAGRVTSLPNPTDFERIEVQAGPGGEAGAGRPAGAGLAPGAKGTAADPEGDGAVLLWVGRLTLQKRPDLAIEVLARLRRDTGRPVRLRIAGEGPLEEAVRRQAAAAGVGEAIDLLGFVANPFAEMRRADLLLLTSDFEGLPNALIEVQGLGLPAVATRCPFGPEEIVEDGVTGRLAPVGDAAALAAAAAELLAAVPEARRRMAEAARRRARERYGLAAAVPRWERLLAEVAGAVPSSRGGAG